MSGSRPVGGFAAWILRSRKVFSEESEGKSEFSYWLLKSEDNGSGKMAVHMGVCECEWCSDGCPVGAKIYEVEKKTAGWFARQSPSLALTVPSSNIYIPFVRVEFWVDRRNARRRFFRLMKFNRKY
ncbi:uncharacterized protein TNCV_88751 [Trichonephila clavipes]|nr:uncharacterized protein TNCV_88751 [Trichonephila clavipes]